MARLATEAHTHDSPFYQKRPVEQTHETEMKPDGRSPIDHSNRQSMAIPSARDGEPPKSTCDSCHWKSTTENGAARRCHPTRDDAQRQSPVKNASHRRQERLSNREARPDNRRPVPRAFLHDPARTAASPNIAKGNARRPPFNFVGFYSPNHDHARICPRYFGFITQN